MEETGGAVVVVVGGGAAATARPRSEDREHITLYCTFQLPRELRCITVHGAHAHL